MTASPTKEIPSEKIPISAPLRWVAQIYSFLFHPIFIPLYVAFFLLYLHPDAFTGFSAAEKMKVFFIITINLVFFPLLSVLLLKALGFIDSILLRTSKDRIIPYIACGIFFFWAYLVFKGQPRYPLMLNSYILGIFLASSGALMANIYFKISMHGIGFGSLLGFFLFLFHTSSMLMSWPLMLAFLVAGLGCSFRLMLKAHRPFEIYAGLILGILAQWMAVFVVF